MLGVAFYVGISTTAPDMEITGVHYFDKTNFYDIHLISTVGFSDEDVECISETDGVNYTEAIYSADMIVEIENNHKIAFRIFSIADLPDGDFDNRINIAQVTEGEYPKQDNECLVDSRFTYLFSIGDTITLEKENAKDDSFLEQDDYIISGFAQSPLYISEERGTTKIADGRIFGFVFVPKTAWVIDYYTEVFVTVNNTGGAKYFDNSYFKNIEPVAESLRVLGMEKAQIRYDGIVDEANEKISDARSKIDEGKEELSDAEQRIEDGEQELRDGEEEFNTKQQEFDDAVLTTTQELSDAKEELDKARSEISSNDRKLQQNRDSYNQSKAALESAEKEIEKGELELAPLKTALDALKSTVSEIEYLQAELQKLKSEYSALIQERDSTLYSNPYSDPRLDLKFVDLTDKISGVEATLKLYPNINEVKPQRDMLQAQYSEAYAVIEASKAELARGRTELAEAEIKLNSAQNDLDSARREYQKGLSEYNKGVAEFDETTSDTLSTLAEKADEIEESKTTLEDKKNEFSEKSVTAGAEIEDAEIELADAEKKLEDLRMPKWFIDDSSLNVGFSNYRAHIQSLRAIGSILPVVFFIVAILVCLNAMTRMVEKDRGGIGTLAALGYSNRKISNKYIVYSLSASLLGSIGGLLIGFGVFPKLIFDSYTVAYTAFPPIEVQIDVWYAIVAVLFAVASALVSTRIVCRRELSTMPSELLRPKAPKAGKKILLERIPFLWAGFGFIYKVAARNIFRYKKRFIMTIVGIAGCTGLLFSGFGMRDSISVVSRRQFGEIKTYRGEGIIKNETHFSELDDLRTYIEDDANIADVLFVRQEALNIPTSTGMKSAYLVAGEPERNLDGFVNLRSLTNQDVLPLTSEGAVITEKLSDVTGAQVGDDLLFTDVDNNEYRIPVAGVVENYLYNNIYVTPFVYRQILDKECMYNGFFAHTVDQSDEAEAATTEYLLKNGEIENVTLVTLAISILDDIVTNLVFVLIVLIISAALLAFVVLFNLNSINLEERTYELASLKVLGFLDREAKAYIFRENLFLTAVGGALGLLLGVAIHRGILSAIEVDMLMYSRSVRPASFAISFVLTLLFALFVNLIMGRKITKINMAQSLNSFE
jgi:putative ABC transport system permease protein